MQVTQNAATVKQPQWGDYDKEDGGVLDEMLDDFKADGQKADAPLRMETEVDKNGIKKVVEIMTNEKGQRVKITTKVKVIHKKVRVNKNVLARRKLPKFGDCAGQPLNTKESNITYVGNEIINLNLNVNKKIEHNPLNDLEGKESIVVCRNCGESGHWTRKCPKERKNQDKDIESSDVASKADGPGKYVPMHKRKNDDNGGKNGNGKGNFNRDDIPSLRVSNLSEDTTENDLQELFQKFGHIKRVYIVKDWQKNVSRGFAFVNYSLREDAERALQNLDGHRYDNLIIHVEWAKPKQRDE